ncbi:MAG: polymer-forming cytoskeletal protein [Candidatus Omnitrophica bacterium]|nr:polymer-forming cytoskeletal protein [Candidatus Omnitrophota bacterium]MDD4940465.1 polymer-forming cytoskeletal protein [Candidatus Omnitrophota bacterium]MDD5774447.1 polymer-forming cytoskeletal protein [Candidatus Omnitrophota bacterium]HNQ51001.1 polymer-forming cytoskeletal protein [Candidatus Omnitrophota bacterium]HQO38791.1 polymer-forming cytoskeletal protein [Candidatus Omnitrophota bacterium]
MAFNKSKTPDKILDVDASMQGTLNFKDPVNLRINGKFDGNLQTQGNLTIGQHAVVTADIVGDTIVIAGRIKGTITARKSLVLLSTAVVEGDVFPASLSIAEGGIFEGRCSMLGEFLNVDELSRYLDVEINLVNEWANSGKIPAVKDDNFWKFERKAIDGWLAQGKIGK